MIAVATFHIPPEGVAAFREYEDAVLPLLAEHGATLRQRLAGADGTSEVHVLHFPDRAAFDAYSADPRRLEHRERLEASRARTELLLDLETAPGVPPKRTHTYETTTEWTGDRGAGTASYRGYDRDHRTVADGRPAIEASSDPSFRGDPARWNPELLLVASLSQCHMLWYLHLCSVSGVVVVAYEDRAEGTMAESGTGAGQFEGVTLRPRVTVAEPAMIEAARALHAKAGAHCFIANSVTFAVRHEPEITAAA